MLGKTISSFNITALEKISDLFGMFFFFNLIFLLDIYVNLVLKFNLFSSPSIIARSISIGNTLGFIAFFSLYMALAWPSVQYFKTSGMPEVQAIRF